VIGQTANILFYLGSRHGLRRRRGGTAVGASLQLIIADLSWRFTIPIIRSACRLYYEDQRQPAKNAPRNSGRKRVSKYLGYFERLLQDNGGSYLTGRRATYADLSLFQIVEGLRYAFPRRMKAFEREIPAWSICTTALPRGQHQGLSLKRPPHRLQRGGHFSLLQGAGSLNGFGAYQRSSSPRPACGESIGRFGGRF